VRDTPGRAPDVAPLTVRAREPPTGAAAVTARQKPRVARPAARPGGRHPKRTGGRRRLGLRSRRTWD